MRTIGWRGKVGIVDTAVVLRSGFYCVIFQAAIAVVVALEIAAGFGRKAIVIENVVNTIGDIEEICDRRILITVGG